MIYINSKKYSYIINTSFDHIDNVALPQWLNKPESLDSRIWNNNVQKITYIIRANDLEKYQLDKLLKSCSYIMVYDETYNRYFLTWFTSIKSSWEGNKNYSLPWKIEIKFISLSETNNGYYGFQLIDATHGFQSGFERIYFT
jgi:hypothetical protein